MGLILVAGVIVGLILNALITKYNNKHECPFCGHGKVGNNGGYKYCQKCLRHWRDFD